MRVVLRLFVLNTLLYLCIITTTTAESEIGCDYQATLDAYCAMMRPTGSDEFKCWAAGSGLMVARKGFNNKGKMFKWRCYNEMKTSNIIEYIVEYIDSNGELTNVGCSDPNPSNGMYCQRTNELEALIN